MQQSSKRASGIFDASVITGSSKSQGGGLSSPPQPPPKGDSMLRRTSKRASSKDRHGQVYADDLSSKAVRPVTHELLEQKDRTGGAPPSDTDLESREDPRREDPIRYEVPHREHMGGANSGEDNDVVKRSHNLRDANSRPRTRTLEERIRNRSPASRGTGNRSRIGSLQSVGHLTLQEDASSSSIGFPSVVSANHSAGGSRIRLVNTPPRPLSPAVFGTPLSRGLDSSASTPSGQLSPVGDAERIMKLMRSTNGRMNGILYFRLSKSSSWQSGYCAINVSTGGLIYQTRGELAQTKTLIPDLRGCRVRTQFDPESNTSFLEMSTRASGLGVHLRPLVPETLDSWLAALLCWQPLRPKGVLNRLSGGQVVPGRPSLGKRYSSGAVPSEGSLRAPSSSGVSASPETKSGKILWWDPATAPSAPMQPTRRISTYKQQRMSAGMPWRKAHASLQEDGSLTLFLESDGSQVAAARLAKLSRYGVQRLHPSVLDDEFCLAVYPQYLASSAHSKERRSVALDEPAKIGEQQLLSNKVPVFMSFDNRNTLEVWFVLLRAFTMPELYGPESSRPQTGQNMERSKSSESKSSRRSDNAGNTDMFRIERRLSLRVIEAHLHLPLLKDSNGNSLPRQPGQDDWVIGDYHAEVQLDREVRGRTALKTDTSEPFWREDYEFADLPPVLNSATILLKSRHAGQRDWTLISDDRYAQEEYKDADHLDLVEDIHISPLDSVYGMVDMQLSELPRGKDIEDWFAVRNEYNEVVGKMYLRIRLDETVVLMSQEYSDLSSILHVFSDGLAQELVASYVETSRIHETLLNIFQVSGRAYNWITSMVEDEIDNVHKQDGMLASKYRFSRRIASNDSYDSGIEREIVLRDMGKSANTEANLLFRANTPLTKVVEAHMRRLSKEYLEDVLSECLRDIDESEPECEVDPSKVRNPEALQRNWRNLILLTESIWRAIVASASKCPAELRQVLRHIRSCAEDRYGAFIRNVSYSSVSAFLFLRLLCPAVLNPKLFGLLKDHPRPKSQRTLTMIAKSLQTLANLGSFGHKEHWMEPMNAFLNSHRQEFKDFIDTVCSISQDRNRPPVPTSYQTPINVLKRLPHTSKEGFPSLPYLIDQAREYAILVGIVLSSKPNRHRPGPNEEMEYFIAGCEKLCKRAIEVLSRAELAERPSGVSEVKWGELIALMENKTRVQSPSSPGSLPSSRPASTRPAAFRSSSAMSAPTPLSASMVEVEAQSKQLLSPTDLDYEPSSTAASVAPTSLTSPTVDSFPVAQGEVTPPGISPKGWDAEDAGASSTSDGASTYIHPLAWPEPDSAGSLASLASSLQSIDIEAANGQSVFPGTSGPNSGGGGPNSSNAISTHSINSVNHPRDQGRRGLADVLSFRRRKADKDRDRENKEKERDRDKDGGQERDGRGIAESSGMSVLGKKRREKREKKEERKRGKDKEIEEGSMNAAEAART